MTGNHSFLTVSPFQMLMMKSLCDDLLKAGLNIHIQQGSCVCVCVWVRQVNLAVLATVSDSVLNGSLSHMATCQQAGRGNIIQRRKAAAISPRTPVWESARFHSRLRLFIRISNSVFFFFVSLSLLFSLIASFCSLISPGSLFTAEFTFALRCLRWLLCCKHKKVWFSHDVSD